MATQTIIVKIVEQPKKSNAIGNKRYRVTKEQDGMYLATFGGRALLTIHPDDVEWEAACK